MTKESEDAAKNNSTDLNIELPEVEQELSKVATNPKQSMLILAGIVCIFGYLAFNWFLSSSNTPKVSEEAVPAEVTKPIQASSEDNVPAIPTLPAPAKLEDPAPPPPPSKVEEKPADKAAEPNTLPELPEGNEIAQPVTPSLPGDTIVTEDEKRRKEAKTKSAIFLISGQLPAKTQEQLQQEAEFKYRGNMNLVLGRGKMLTAVIESAISSDFGGEIRAIINRDVYSEWGKNILIPKGSRIYGNYVAGNNGAYGRVAIEWTRVDLANGYVLNLSGTGVDDLGRKGKQGRVDNKFKERFGNAILRSAFNVVLADALDKLVKPKITSQAATTNNATAASIRNIATSIFTQTGLADGAKREQICSSVLANIQDTTSTAYTSVQAACESLRTDTSGSSDADKLKSLMSTINNSADNIIQGTATQTEDTKAQAAAKQAFTDISDLAKEMIESQKFEPTTTIDQGSMIKIYVNKDYAFPKAAVSKVLK